jgi:hypothetical protein
VSSFGRNDDVSYVWKKVFCVRRKHAGALRCCGEDDFSGGEKDQCDSGCLPDEKQKDGGGVSGCDDFGDCSAGAESPTTFGPCGRWPWTVSSRLAPFRNVSRDVFGRDGRVALPPAKEERCLVDEDSDQPAFEGAFAAEPWGVARGRETTVFYRLFGFFSAVEDAAGDEMKQFAAARELQLEGALDLFAGRAVGFEVAATNGNVDLLDAFRGRGEEFLDGVCHKHHVFGLWATKSIGRVCSRLHVHTNFLHLPDKRKGTR